MSQPRLYQWRHTREPVTPHSVPMSILRMDPYVVNLDPPEAQARRIAAELADLPPGTPRVLLADWLGAKAMRSTPAADIWRHGVPREYDRPILRAAGAVFREHRVKFDLIAADLEEVINEDRTGRGVGDLPTVAACWPAAALYPLTAKDLCGPWEGPHHAARAQFRREADAIRNDYLRWALDTSNYLPCRAGRCCNYDGQGSRGRVLPDGTSEVVLDFNGVPSPSHRPGKVDSPVCYLWQPGDSERVKRNIRIIRDTSDGELIPWASDRAFSRRWDGTKWVERYDDADAAEWHDLMVWLLTEAGVTELLWWSFDPDRGRAHAAWRAVYGEVAEMTGRAA